MKTRHLLLFTLGLFTAVARADASTLYGSTSAGGPGELFIIDPATGNTVQDIGPLNDTDGNNYPLTGIAFNPITGVLYGSSANSNPTTKDKLVTVDPATAVVTVIGLFNAGSGNAMADLAFDSAGNLYGVSSSGGASLYSVNTSTGQATKIGSSGFSLTAGGGLAISAGSVFYSMPEGNDFGTFDPVSGGFSLIGTSDTPAGTGTSYAALAFDGDTLYGLDLGAPPHLVTIDPGSGAISDIGVTVSAIDGIAFQPVIAPPRPTLTIQATNNGVILGWPASATGFRLQQNSDLTTTNWTANTNPTNVIGGTNQVTISPTAGNNFFRLISP